MDKSMESIITGRSEISVPISEDHSGFQTVTVTEAFYQENILQKIQYIKPKGVE